MIFEDAYRRMHEQGATPEQGLEAVFAIQREQRERTSAGSVERMARMRERRRCCNLGLTIPDWALLRVTGRNHRHDEELHISPLEKEIEKDKTRGERELRSRNSDLSNSFRPEKDRTKPHANAAAFDGRGHVAWAMAEHAYSEAGALWQIDRHREWLVTLNPESGDYPQPSDLDEDCRRWLARDNNKRPAHDRYPKEAPAALPADEGEAEAPVDDKAKAERPPDAEVKPPAGRRSKRPRARTGYSAPNTNNKTEREIDHPMSAADIAAAARYSLVGRDAQLDYRHFLANWRSRDKGACADWEAAYEAWLTKEPEFAADRAARRQRNSAVRHNGRNKGRSMLGQIANRDRIDLDDKFAALIEAGEDPFAGLIGQKHGWWGSMGKGVSPVDLFDCFLRYHALPSIDQLESAYCDGTLHDILPDLHKAMSRVPMLAGPSTNLPAVPGFADEQDLPFMTANEPPGVTRQRWRRPQRLFKAQERAERANDDALAAEAKKREQEALDARRKADWAYLHPVPFDPPAELQAAWKPVYEEGQRTSGHSGQALHPWLWCRLEPASVADGTLTLVIRRQGEAEEICRLLKQAPGAYFKQWRKAWPDVERIVVCAVYPPPRGRPLLKVSAEAVR